jgi:hypothetical protein
MTVSELKIELARDYEDLVSKGLRLHGAMPNKREGSAMLMSVPDETEIHSSTHHLLFSRPFIFDLRKLPETFRGFDVKPLIGQEDMPEEFRADEYELMPFHECWSEEHILTYAEEHALEICEQLNDYSLTLKDICNMIAFGDFEKHKETIR